MFSFFSWPPDPWISVKVYTIANFKKFIGHLGIRVISVVTLPESELFRIKQLALALIAIRDSSLHISNF